MKKKIVAGFGESDAIVAKKTAAALEGGLHPILCIGEILAERDGNCMEEVLERQLRKGLGDCSSLDLGSVVIAYEPVWAIGTGKTAPPPQNPIWGAASNRKARKH